MMVAVWCKLEHEHVLVSILVSSLAGVDGEREVKREMAVRRKCARGIRLCVNKAPTPEMINEVTHERMTKKECVATTCFSFQIFARRDHDHESKA